MVVRGSAWREAICTSRRLTPASKHGGDEGVAQHVRVHLWHLDPGGGGQVLEPAGRCVPVHPRFVGVAQDRTGFTALDGTVEGAGHRWWKRDEDDLAALAAHPQDAVAVFFSEVADVGAAGFEDPQPEQARHGDQGEVVGVVRLPCGGDHGLELQMPQPEGG